MENLLPPVRLALLFTFWVPPAVVGWRLGSATWRRRGFWRSASILGLTSVLWGAAWIAILMMLMGRYVPTAPSDPRDAPAMVFVGLVSMAVVVVVPGGLLSGYAALRCR